MQPANEHNWVMTLCSGVVGSCDPPHIAVRLSLLRKREVLITIAQRVVMKFLTNENVGPNEILCRVCTQYGESALSKTQVKFWHKEFCGGRDAVQNTSHQWCPRISITLKNIAAVHVLIEGDRRLTVVETCQELGTYISYESVQSIIKNKLLFRTISAWWVPRLLSDQQKTDSFKFLKHCWRATKRKETHSFIA